MHLAAGKNTPFGHQAPISTWHHRHRRLTQHRTGFRESRGVTASKVYNIVPAPPQPLNLLFPSAAALDYTAS